MHRSKQHLYSITSSARTSNEGGTVRPSALAARSAQDGLSGSDTHQLHFMEMMGFAGLNPSYDLIDACVRGCRS
jgi:hypothetical protein